MKHARLASFVLTFALAGSVATTRAQEAPLNVLATTSILADVAQRVAGDRFVVDTLVPRGADTHAYEPTTADIVRVSEADLLLEVGAGYEAFLEPLIDNAEGDFTLVTVNNGVSILGFSGEHAHGDDEHDDDEHDDEHGDDEHDDDEHDDEHGDEHGDDEHGDHGGEAEALGVLGNDLVCGVHDDDEHDDEEHDDEEHDDDSSDDDHDEHEGHDEDAECDPHTWLDVRNVMTWTQNIAAAFSEADPANAGAYQANAEAYLAELEALDAELTAMVEAVPAENRVLVTNHEFLGYFAARYGFEVVGTVLPSITTDVEPDPQSLAELVETVRDESAMAVFAEVSANPQLAEVVAAEAGVPVVADLYSESLSEVGGPADSYLAFMRHNVGRIVAVLGGM
jgi:ABC-type Zn uptake system ZnuABC Zn-binding protein ZnuA